MQDSAARFTRRADHPENAREVAAAADDHDRRSGPARANSAAGAAKLAVHVDADFGLTLGPAPFELLPLYAA